MRIAMLVLWALATAPISGAALAQSADFPVCRNGGFTLDDKDGFYAATVKGPSETRAYFMKDNNGCPDASTCAYGPYLIPGDRLLTSVHQNGWVCSYYRKGSSGRDHAGWIKADLLEIDRSKRDPVPKDWIGSWVAWDNRITISPGMAQGSFHVEGLGVWHGTTDHFGNFQGDAKPKANLMIISQAGPPQTACIVTLTLVDQKLVARDNKYCGALNVRFTQVYMKHGAGLSPP